MRIHIIKRKEKRRNQRRLPPMLRSHVHCPLYRTHRRSPGNRGTQVYINKVGFDTRLPHRSCRVLRDCGLHRKPLVLLGILCKSAAGNAPLPFRLPVSLKWLRRSMRRPFHPSSSRSNRSDFSFSSRSSRSVRRIWIIVSAPPCSSFSMS